MFAGPDQVIVSESTAGEEPEADVTTSGFVVTGVELDVVAGDGPAAFVATTENV